MKAVLQHARPGELEKENTRLWKLLEEKDGQIAVEMNGRLKAKAENKDLRRTVNLQSDTIQSQAKKEKAHIGEIKRYQEENDSLKKLLLMYDNAHTPIIKEEFQQEGQGQVQGQKDGQGQEKRQDQQGQEGKDKAQG